MELSILKGNFQKLLSVFFAKGVHPPTYPLSRKSFCKKTLAEMGNTPPP